MTYRSPVESTRPRRATGVIALAAGLLLGAGSTAQAATKRAAIRRDGGSGGSATQSSDGMRRSSLTTPAGRNGEGGVSSGGDACMDSYQEARHSERAGALMEAREFWTKCALPRCNAFLQERCTIAVMHLESDIPSVVLAATDAAGNPRDDVQVNVDGRLLMASLDGRARGVDPGMHEFSFTMDGHLIATRKVMVVQGQRNRLITVEVPAAGHEARAAAALREGAPPRKLVHVSTPAASAPPTAPAHLAEDTGRTSSSSSAAESSPPPAPAKQSPKLALAVGGVGVAALGAGVLLTMWGRKDNAALSQCSTPDAPGLCEQGAIDHIKKLYLAADISLGVGVVAVVSAYALYRRAQHQGEKEEEGDSAPGRRLSFNLRPSRAGAIASVGGSF